MSRYMPKTACELAFDWLQRHPAKLKITRPRRTKLGDFRIDRKTDHASISVNGDLNPIAFTITFAHEVAHLFDYRERQSLREPHGTSWQAHYRSLLEELKNAGAFPVDMLPVLDAHIQRPKAASCSDSELLRQLRTYDEQPATTLEEIPEGARFSINGKREFVKGALRRTRYRCFEPASGKTYLIHKMTAIELHEA